MQFTEKFLDAFNAKVLLALKNLPNNPKPQCEGFIVHDIVKYKNSINLIENTFQVGIVPNEKRTKYQYFANKKAMETRYRRTPLSRNFAEADVEKERYPGGIFRDMDDIEKAIGVSGHDSMVDEALALIYHYAENAFCHVTQKEWNVSFSQNFLARIEQLERATDNPYTLPLARLIAA